MHNLFNRIQSSCSNQTQKEEAQNINVHAQYTFDCQLPITSFIRQMNLLKLWLCGFVQISKFSSQDFPARILRNFFDKSYATAYPFSFAWIFSDKINNFLFC